MSFAVARLANPGFALLIENPDRKDLGFGINGAFAVVELVSHWPVLVA